MPSDNAGHGEDEKYLLAAQQSVSASVLTRGKTSVSQGLTLSNY